MSRNSLTEPLESRTLLSAISDAAYPVLHQQSDINPTQFYVYKDGDSGFNHGFASGKFAINDDPQIISAITVSPFGIYDASSPTGVSSDPNALDSARNNVLQIAFPALSAGLFAGLSIEEPEGFSAVPTGRGYDLTGAARVVFDAASPTPGGAEVQFGVGGRNTDRNNLFTLTPNFTTISIPLDTLRDPGTNVILPPDLSNVHTLFSTIVIGPGTPDGTPRPVTVLLDNIRFEPVPTSHLAVPALPLDTVTYGAVPAAAPNTPIPPDQANRNLSTIYATSLTVLALLNRGTPADLTTARALADAMVYALGHDIKGEGAPGQGDPLPTTPDGSSGLHSGYSGGDLPLFNDQATDRGLQGQTRLAGFTGPTGSFFLEDDGATGGNNAFAILALMAAYRRFGDAAYLNASREIGNWIVGTLADTSGTGYDGYYLGFADATFPKQRQLVKSTENNADIFAAFTELSSAETATGNASEAADWTARANVAGDYVMAMYDPAGPRFNAGSVLAGTPAFVGVDPTGVQQGTEVINRADFLDADSFTTLAMAASPRYHDRIDWRGPVQYMLDHFAQTITAAGQTFQGFDIVPQPTPTPTDNRNTPGPNGIAWEFTGQAVEAMLFADAIYGDTRFANAAALYLGEIAHAQSAAPFGDGQGLVAATVQGGDQLPPVNQGLTTPFQFIPERVALPSTDWAILADNASNPLAPRLPAAGPALTFATPPLNITAGGKLRIIVNAEDRSGNLLTSDRPKVMLNIVNGPPGARLIGATTATAKKGVATFNISARTAGDYTLNATAAGLLPAAPTRFSVAPATATKLVFASQPPASVTANQVFGLEVNVLDRYGNLVTGETGTIILGLGKHPKSSALSGTTTVSFTAGVAAFDDLSIGQSGDYTVLATHARLKATSARFHVI